MNTFHFMMAQTINEIRANQQYSDLRSVLWPIDAEK